MTRFRYLDLSTAVAWAGVVDTITGESADLAKKAQKKQEAMLATERRNVDAVEAGQRQVAQGGGGLLAYVDDAIKVKRKTLG